MSERTASLGDVTGGDGPVETAPAEAVAVGGGPSATAPAEVLAPGAGSDGAVLSRTGSGGASSPADSSAVAPAGAAGGRKAVLVRLDPAVHSALARWAADDLRSVNAQIEVVLRDGLARAGRLPSGLQRPGRPGRPPAA